MADLLIVGSGPSGAQAAKEAIRLGMSVDLVDVGNDDEAFRKLIPERPFSEIREQDPQQRRYFLDETLGVGGNRVGAQLTPSRQFLVRDVESALPFESKTFSPLMSLALGGLGAGWGAGAQTFEPAELHEAGLSGLIPWYQSVADDIGVSGAREDDTAAALLSLRNVQDPLEIDTGTSALFEAYRKKRERYVARGFLLGRAPAAILSQDRGGRKANPLFDLDFYADCGESVYRPRYTIRELEGREGFRYLRGMLALKFKEDDAGVELTARELKSGSVVKLRAKKLLLAAGAINTARIVLSSQEKFGTRVPLLCNSYEYIPTVQLRMLGRPAKDRRHSLGQLVGVYTPPDRPADRVITSFYSYRALLLYKLVKEMPLPPVLGLQIARLLETSLTIVGLHHPDRFSSGKWLELRRKHGQEVLTGEYQNTKEESGVLKTDLEAILSNLRSLGCIPFGVIRPGAGSSIHYAGTLPQSSDPTEPLRTHRGRLNLTKNVFIGDSASWTYLPAKGLTLTLMANARKMAQEVHREI